MGEFRSGREDAKQNLQSRTALVEVGVKWRCSKRMETSDRSPEPKEVSKSEDEKRREEEEDILVVDIDEGREKSTARRPTSSKK